MILYFGLSVSSSAFVTATIALGLRSAAYRPSLPRCAPERRRWATSPPTRSDTVPVRRSPSTSSGGAAPERPGFPTEFTIVLKDPEHRYRHRYWRLLTRARTLDEGGQSTAALEIFVRRQPRLLRADVATNGRSTDQPLSAAEGNDMTQPLLSIANCTCPTGARSRKSSRWPRRAT